MNAVIYEILSEGVVRYPNGELTELHSAIDAEEGALLFDVVAQDEAVRATLEVGCAYGLSSLHICEGMRGRSGAHHTVIDPFQKTQWGGVGVFNLERAGFQNFTLVEEKSEFALPRLLQERGAERFDLVFVDGWHTFDHTLLDCFFATRMLRIGGYLVVDDVGLPAVRRAMDYLLEYPCYEYYRSVSVPQRRSVMRALTRTAVSAIPAALRRRVLSREFLRRTEKVVQSMVALRKTAPDERPWNWYSGYF